MPNDARLGFAVGVALVITLAVAYCRSDPAPASSDAAAIVEQTDAPPVRDLPKTSAAVNATALDE